jgi:predicted CoA-binding protein
MQNYVVFGASPNPLRHSNKAVKSLVRRNRNVIPLGFRKGEIAGLEIVTGLPEIECTDNLLLYIGPKRQPEFYDYILKLHPKRIIFNPGTENPEFQKMAEVTGIEVIVDCSLVMINGGQL